MQTFRLLILTHTFFPGIGGTETNAEFLAGAMYEAGVDVTLITWTKETGNKKFPYTVIRNPGLLKLIQQHLKADLVFENHLALRLSWPLLISRKPYVVALNTWVNVNTSNALSRLKKWWLRRAGAVIAVSNAVKHKEWPGAIVIENAYNDLLFKRYETIQKTKPFVYFGRLVTDKGVALLIEALGKLKNDNGVKGDYRLTIVGDGPEREKIKEKVSRYGLDDMVEWEGVKTGEGLVQVLNRHKYIVVPSTWEEPYGIVALEGMACGCIPIVADAGGLPEAVGNAGILFKRNDLVDLVNKMKYIVTGTGLQHALRDAAERKLKTNTAKVVAGKYLQVFREVLQQC